MRGKDRRAWAVMLLALAIVAMTLLAAGLSNVELAPGRPLPRGGEMEAAAGAILGDGLLSSVLGILNRLFLLLLPLAILYVIVSKDARRRVLTSLGLLLWILAFYLLIRNRPEVFQQLQMLAPGAPTADQGQVLPVDLAVALPGWVVWLVTLGLALLVAGSLVGVGWILYRRSRPRPDALSELGAEVQEAIAAIYAGADVRDTVMRCYFEMSRILSEQRGLHREAAMTPREFERELRETGLPDLHITQLTRLFERARYGARVAGPEEEQEALSSLAAVAEACRSNS